MALLIACAARPGSSQAQELANDGFGTGMQVGYQGGFDPEEIGAVKLTPPAGLYQLMSVSFLFGGSMSTEGITLHVWEDSGADSPGRELYSGDYDLQGQDDARQQIDLQGESIFVTGPFRVGIEKYHVGFPGIAVDTDGTIAADKNFIASVPAGDAGVRTWARSMTFGLRGDFIIRATVRGSGVADAAVLDAGGRDAAREGGADGGDDGGGDGGCGCRAGARAGAGAGAGAGLVMVVLLGLLVVRRR